MLHVALSKERDPLDDETEQLLTRPLAPMVRVTTVVPCSSLSIACCG